MRTPWLPLLTALDCLLAPFTVARKVRRMCADHERDLADAERVLRQACRERDIAQAEVMRLEAECRTLRASRDVHGFVVRGGWS